MLLNFDYDTFCFHYTAYTNPFSQYQQKEQNAYQSLQSYFDQQRYLIQHQQLLQTLNQCCAQLQQQQIDLGCLQGQFQQLFSGNSGASPAGPSSVPGYAPPSRSSTNPFVGPNSVPPAPGFPSLHVYSNPSMFPNPSVSASNSFNFSPFQVGGTSETPAGFTPATLNQSDLQWPPPSVSQAGNLRAPSWMSVFTDPFRFPSQSTQTDHIANPDTGVPSPRYSGLGSYSSAGAAATCSSAAFGAPLAPLAPSSLNSTGVLKNYNPSAYAGNSFEWLYLYDLFAKDVAKSITHSYEGNIIIQITIRFLE